jgi:hypothetical protein
MGLFSDEREFRNSGRFFSLAFVKSDYRLVIVSFNLKQTEETIMILSSSSNQPCHADWHFLIEGPPDTPYEGGWYVGKLRFSVGDSISTVNPLIYTASSSLYTLLMTQLKAVIG